MPDEDEAQVEEQLKTPEQKTITLPPSAPKKPAPAPAPPEIQATRKSTREIKLSQKARDSATPKTKLKANKSPDEDSTYQWPDNGVFKDVHPDYKWSPTTALLAVDGEVSVFHIDHDAHIVSAIQDANSDPKSLIEPLKRSNWPLLEGGHGQRDQLGHLRARRHLKHSRASEARTSFAQNGSSALLKSTMGSTTSTHTRPSPKWQVFARL